ncbi:hypothetical protein C8R44DRAFT_890206 [Mycena epipterygia]|nr:hypothetical protein C8R44DRAFT_890206 [Mycena epipterygia]
MPDTRLHDNVLPSVLPIASKNAPLTDAPLRPRRRLHQAQLHPSWAGRSLFLGTVAHGSLWINNHILRRVRAEVMLLYSEVLVVHCPLSDLLPPLGELRVETPERWYAASAFPALFVALCYHTIYAASDISAAGVLRLLRAFRWKVMEGRVEVKEPGISLIHIPLATRGWRACRCAL